MFCFKLEALDSTEFDHLVWTRNLQRMAVLVGRALQFGEPVLLVGETGYVVCFCQS